MFRIAIMMSSLTTLRATSKLVVFLSKNILSTFDMMYSVFSIKTAILAILVAVIGLSIGFAALNATLKITANTTLKGTNWSIIFQNVGSAEIVRAAKKASLTQIEESKTEFTINVEFRLASPVADNI